MWYELINEFDIAASADDVWAVYSSPDLPKLIVELLRGVFENIEVVEGNGGLVYPNGSVPLSYKETFVTMDNQKRLKEVRQIEGGYLEMRCTFYMDSFQILKKTYDSCTIRSITKYEVSAELAEKVSSHVISVESLIILARAISKYVIRNNEKRAGPSTFFEGRDESPKKHVHLRRIWLCLSDWVGCVEDNNRTSG
ncbi:S-norcoclaurine synthase 2-like [Papaver somniferum]|uniref:S-norcoclaurine synthase 2-like n=1 Tax=Papaver somniferum TaxID=3469 RepID=UPI000E6F9D76|nr:S-norcoclaurine synthase 2-like [Papaver somniferum]